jgi:hypothetical protein
MNRDEVATRLTTAIELLTGVDHDLLLLDANERSVTHRLAVHMDPQFEGWNVDCEYNRNRNFQKLLELPVERVPSDDTEARTVFPDIIVHRRNTEENLLVIEARKRTARQRGLHQCVKLRAYVEQLRYRHAVFVVFDTTPRGTFEFVD